MVTSLRRLLRRFVPLALRWRLRQRARSFEDCVRRPRFADGTGASVRFRYRVAEYALPLRCYPGQEARFEGKRHNIARALAQFDGLVIAPGETLSFWRRVGRPTERGGYKRAAALKARLLTEDIGGSICLASTLLYNAGLLAAMRITERSCHSVDSYGADRYFELGRDSSVEYAYRDLRMRNELPASLLLRTRVEANAAVAEVWSARPLALRVEINVGEPLFVEPPIMRTLDASLRTGTVVDDPGLVGVEVRTRRIVRLDGVARHDDLGVSRHLPMPRHERIAPAAAARDGRVPLT